MSKFAWVTLATNDSYSLGALVVASSLKRVNTAHELVVLVTPGVSAPMRSKLSAVFNLVEEVNVLDSQDSAHLALLSRPELGITFTKLHCWRLQQYEKCVFLDADTLVLKNSDELFEREELSASPDVGWPDCFNTGVFVFKPSLETYTKLIEFAKTKGSFDGGDQGLLNQFFADWSTKDISKHLPFIYNTTTTAVYSYIPAFKQFGENVKILHFIGSVKPWLLSFNSQLKTVNTPQGYQHVTQFLQLWWNIFCDDIHSTLSPDMNLTRPINGSTESNIIENNNQMDVVSISWFDNSMTFQILPPQFELFPSAPVFPCPDNEIFVYDPWENFEEIQNTNDIQNNTIAIQNNINNIRNNNENIMIEDVEIISETVDPILDGTQDESVLFEKTGIAGALAQLTLGQSLTPEQEAFETQMRRQCWESGNIDYLGKDSFDNIWRHITQNIESGSKQEFPQAPPQSDSTPQREDTPLPDEKLKVDIPKTEVGLSSTLEEDDKDANIRNVIAVCSPHELLRSLSSPDLAQEQIITTILPDGKIVTQKILTFPEREIEIEDHERIEILGPKTRKVTTETTRVVAGKKSETQVTVQMSTVSHETHTTKTEQQNTESIQATQSTTTDSNSQKSLSVFKPTQKSGTTPNSPKLVITDVLKPLLNDKVEFDSITNTTTITRPTPTGYEVIIATISPDGRSRVQTKTFFNPIEVTSIKEICEKATEEIVTEERSSTTSNQLQQTSSEATSVETTVTDEAKRARIAEILKPQPNDKIEYNETTNVTTITRKTTTGYEIITATKRVDGTYHVQTQTIFNPVEIPGNEEVTEEYEESVTEETITTSSTNKNVGQTQTVDKTITKKETGDTNTTEVEITEVTTESIDSSKTSSNPSSKKVTQKPDEETPNKGNITDVLKPQPNDKVEYDAEKCTTTITRPTPTGYEIIIGTKRTDGTYHVQTKTFFNPVEIPGSEEVTEETEEVTEETTTTTTSSQPQTVSKPGSNAPVSQPKSKTTTTDVDEVHKANINISNQNLTEITETETIEVNQSTTLTNIQQQTTPNAGNPTPNTGVNPSEPDLTDLLKPQPDDIVEYDETTNVTKITRKTTTGYEIIIGTKRVNGTYHVQTKTFFDPIEIPGSEEVTEETEEVTEETTTTSSQIKSATNPGSNTPISQPKSSVTTTDVVDEVNQTNTKINNQNVTEITETLEVNQLKTSTNVQETTSSGNPSPNPGNPSPNPNPGNPSQITGENPAKPDITEVLKPQPNDKIEFDPVTNTTTITRPTPTGYEVIIGTKRPDGTNQVQTKTYFNPVEIPGEEEIIEEIEEEEITEESTTTTSSVPKKTAPEKSTPNQKTKRTVDGEEIIETKEIETTVTEEEHKYNNKPNPTPKTGTIDTNTTTATNIVSATQTITHNTQSSVVRTDVSVSQNSTVTEEIVGSTTIQSLQSSPTPNGNPKNPHNPHNPHKKATNVTEKLETTETITETGNITKSNPKNVTEIVETTVTETTTGNNPKKNNPSPSNGNPTKKDKTLVETTTEEIEVTETTQTGGILVKEVTSTLPMLSSVPVEKKNTKKTDIKTKDTKNVDTNVEEKTTITIEKTATGHKEIHTTITADGLTKVETKTFYDPVAIPGDEIEETEEYEETTTNPTVTTTKTTKTGNPGNPGTKTETDDKSKKNTKKNTKDETTVVATADNSKTTKKNPTDKSGKGNTKVIEQETTETTTEEVTTITTGKKSGSPQKADKTTSVVPSKINQENETIKTTTTTETTVTEKKTKAKKKVLAKEAATKDKSTTVSTTTAPGPDDSKLPEGEPIVVVTTKEIEDGIEETTTSTYPDGTKRIEIKTIYNVIVYSGDEEDEEEIIEYEEIEGTPDKITTITTTIPGTKKKADEKDSADDNASKKKDKKERSESPVPLPQSKQLPRVELKDLKPPSKPPPPEVNVSKLKIPGIFAVANEEPAKPNFKRNPKKGEGSGATKSQAATSGGAVKDSPVPPPRKKVNNK